MDALAAWQLKKKQALEEEKAVKDSSDITRPTSYEDERKLNKLFGFPDPPSQCFSLGRDGCAVVWWTYDESLEGIIGWEVHKYRKDGSIWQKKGLISFETLSPLQVMIENLNNGHEYRFTVKAINDKGPGLESPPSNSVYVDSPLPPGWYRFYDRKAEKFYFASLKTGRSSWTRPETDPDFLGDDVYKRFTKKEIIFLKKLFIEDMEHFQCIKADQVPEIIREVGEQLTKKKIAYFFNMISGDPTKLNTWQQFVQFMVAIKEEKNRKIIETGPLQYFMRCIRRQKMKVELKSSRNKLGAWVIEYNGLIQKNFYRNTQTGATSWLMPDEVKFFIPKSVEKKLFRIFDPGQIEDMKTYFSLLDIDNSGDLSQKEISLLLDAMGIHIEDKQLDNLIKTIDMNGNGTVEFDEFCWMMFELAKKDKSIVSKQAKRNAVSEALASSLQDNDSNQESKQREMTFVGLKRAVSILRKGKENDLDNDSISTLGSKPFQLTKAFSSFRGNVNPNSSQSTTLSIFRRSNKVSDEHSVSSFGKSSKKASKKQPNPDLYKPKPKKLKKQKSITTMKQIVQESDSDEDYDEDYGISGDYAFTKQKSGTFFGLSKSASQKSVDSNNDVHSKDCMCGCRRF